MRAIPARVVDHLRVAGNFVEARKIKPDCADCLGRSKVCDRAASCAWKLLGELCFIAIDATDATRGSTSAETRAPGLARTSGCTWSCSSDMAPSNRDRTLIQTCDDVCVVSSIARPRAVSPCRIRA